MKVLILLTFILPTKDTLPPAADLFASLQTYHLSQTNAQLVEYQESTKGDWLKYIPNVSFGYGLGTKEIDGQTQVVGKFRPSASFSTSIIYNAKKNKQLRVAKLKAIEQTQQLALQDAERKLTQLLANYYQELESLQFAEEIQVIDDQIYAIEEAKYNDLQIKPADFLKIRRGYLIKRLEEGERQKGVGKLEGEILEMAKWH